MGIHDHHGARLARQQEFVGVRGASGSASASCGSLRHLCEPGTMRMAPFSGVKSSSIQTELQTQ